MQWPLLYHQVQNIVHKKLIEGHINFLDIIYYIIAPFGAPQDLTTTDVDFTNVTIEWDPVECSQRNGEIDGYRLIYYPTMNSDDNESILIDGSNTNTFTIIGLQPRVNYTLILRAVGGNYTLAGEMEIRESVETSMPHGIIVLPISGPFFNRYNVNIQVLDFSSTVKCMATTA